MARSFAQASSMLKISLKSQVRQTQLPQSKPLLPLFEAVMNSFHAIQDSPQKGGHAIVIDVERELVLDVDAKAGPVSSFTITDTGVGFNDDNFESFNTSFSEYKASRGGKGLGRFIWLKAFDRVEVDSIFRESDSEHLWQRKFVFDTTYDPDKATALPTEGTRIGTRVKLNGFKDTYKRACPRAIDSIITRLIEHFIVLFLDPHCPRVELHDAGLVTSLNEVFAREFKANASDYTFHLKDAPFSVQGFRLTGTRSTKNKLIFAANAREVQADNLGNYMPNLSGRLFDTDQSSFVYLAVVQSAYLDQRVNNERTAFNIASEDASDEAQTSLLTNEIKLGEIRDAALERVRSDLSSYLDALNAVKEDRVQAYVQTEAPQYKILMKYRAQFLDKISPSATNVDIEAALHRELHQREVDLKEKSSKIIEAAKLEDYDAYRDRLSGFMEEYNELGVSSLTQYVMHRKIIIELLERAIDINTDTEKYPLEKAVHNIIFPMKTTSSEILHSQQNLWLVDERLAYHSFISSDRPLTSLDELSSESLKRPDLFLFDRKLAFVEGEQPINSIMVVEFKRPKRDDYESFEDDPLTQVFNMIKEIRGGRFKDAKGNYISVSNNTIPASAYVICDLTQSFQEALDNYDATLMPDRQGYYGYHRKFGVYYEVMDYNKLVRDAKKRNRIFFDHLNIAGSH